MPTRRKFGEAFSRAVHEIRVNLPATEEPPFDLQLILLVRGDSLTAEEADAIDAAVAVMRAGVDPTLIHLDPEVRILSDEQMSVAEYFASRPLFLEYLTFSGDELEGAEPFRRS